MVGVVPYVPTAALPLLQRDTLRFESDRSYDGGPDGVRLLRRVVAESPHVPAPRRQRSCSSWAATQADLLADDLARAGFGDVDVLVDDEGDVRGIEATRAS